MKHRRHIRALVLVIGLALAVCGAVVSAVSEREMPSPETAQTASIETARTASLETDDTTLRTLKTIPHVPVEGIAGPNDSAFFVKSRQHELPPASCSACHADMPPTSAASLAPVERRTMHLDVTLNHASADSMDCQTCHDAAGPAALQMLNGRRVSFDHAYQLCAQCHFQQVRDWAGGAHGKRLAGWRGRRVVNNCADCHDPHAPAIEARLPDPGPRFPNTGGQHE